MNKKLQNKLQDSSNCSYNNNKTNKSNNNDNNQTLTVYAFNRSHDKCHEVSLSL